MPLVLVQGYSRLGGPRQHLSFKRRLCLPCPTRSSPSQAANCRCGATAKLRACCGLLKEPYATTRWTRTGKPNEKDGGPGQSATHARPGRNECGIDGGNQNALMPPAPPCPAGSGSSSSRAGPGQPAQRPSIPFPSRAPRGGGDGAAILPCAVPDRERRRERPGRRITSAPGAPGRSGSVRAL